MSEEIVISSRFNGPPDSGQGGYVCGMVASYIEGPTDIMLRRSPPLRRPLQIDLLDDLRVLLRDGEHLVAQARPDGIHIDMPEPPTYREAEHAVSRYIGFEDHAYPTCFGCGL